MYFLLLLAVLSLVSGVYTCPSNCICDIEETYCFLKKCSDEIFYEYKVLIIEGKLCINHREVLNILKDYDITLITDVCDQIPNCR